ncbi:DUF2239 family protein [Deinococcus altitudinis]|uniref:DUF2239 family protein n=1 Tax=Deinococcus altitudinis TaxID=468914 RepID=UPI0038915B64
MNTEPTHPEPTYTTFVGMQRLVTAPLAEMLRQTRAHLDRKGAGQVLIFSDASGQQQDYDFTGTFEQVLDRAVPALRTGPGRPKLGVVSREVSLLPRHWDWLETQRGGASAALRRLIDEARKADPEGEHRRLATEAAGRFMTVMAGDLPGYEEASRALYAHDTERLHHLTQGWPEAVQTHLLYLLDPPFNSPA